MSFAKFSGKMSPQEVKKMLKCLHLYSTSQVMRAKGKIPKTHKVDNLKSKNDNWKELIK